MATIIKCLLSLDYLSHAFDALVASILMMKNLNLAISIQNTSFDFRLFLFYLVCVVSILENLWVIPQ